MENFRKFYIETKDSLFAFLIRLSGDYHLSRDIMQESFSRLLGRYGPDNPSKPLLFTIARNLFYDLARKNRKDAEFKEDGWRSTDNPERNIIIKESYRHVLTAMKQLDSSDREILAMVVSSGMTYREIAAILNISTGNVKVKVHRARIKLRKLL